MVKECHLRGETMSVSVRQNGAHPYSPANRKLGKDSLLRDELVRILF